MKRGATSGPARLATVHRAQVERHDAGVILARDASEMSSCDESGASSMVVSRSTHPDSRRRADQFSHEMVLYSSDDDYVAATASFVRDGLEAGEPILVIVGSQKARLLREALERDVGDDRAAQFIDMADLGANPARIIPAWMAFVDHHAGRGRPLRGIGEPIWSAQTAAELIECQRHETLLNVAFGDGPPWRLLCPYDADHLPPHVLDDALRNHPFIIQDGIVRDSAAYRGVGRGDGHAVATLPPAPPGAEALAFDAATIRELREFVARVATRARLDDVRRDDLVLAVHEVATNSIRYGGGKGRLSTWTDGDELVFEVVDRGTISDPLVGRRPPSVGKEGGRGLWLANHLCDLVQVRSSPAGTAIRIRTRVR